MAKYADAASNRTIPVIEVPLTVEPIQIHQVRGLHTDQSGDLHKRGIAHDAYGWVPFDAVAHNGLYRYVISRP